MDLLAEKCSKNACCILTTHSTDIIAHVPKECLRLVIRNQAKSEIINCPDDGQLEMLLGARMTKSLIAFTEDRCARIITKEAIRFFRPDVLSQIYVTDAGSETDVLAILRHFPVDTPSPVIVGILDGDQRNKVETVLENGVTYLNPRRHRIEFLPGTVAPEIILKESSRSRADDVAKAFNIDRARMAAIFSSLNGLDHHDWLEELAKRLGVSFDHAILTLFHVILDNTEIREDYEALVSRIASLI